LTSVVSVPRANENVMSESSLSAVWTVGAVVDDDIGTVSGMAVVELEVLCMLRVSVL
jgi:hypothetical protein